ncbi:MAG TPA: hypothetical protein VFR22_05740 [Nocardioidaceae bacterium]|nr:hypothetical protein [Nocardioidaceae bacterium]
MMVRRILPALAAVVVLGGCVTPALNDGAFRVNATSALDSAASVTAAAELAVQARLSDQATRAYTDVVVTESEQEIDPIEASFGSVDPPSPANDDLRDTVLDALGQAGDALAHARIAVRRDDPDAMREAHDELAAALEQLHALNESIG